MAQISKLYKFYLKKIFKKNWIRITVVSLLLVGAIWFGLPYLFFKGGKKVVAGDLEEMEKNPNISEEKKRKLQERKVQTNLVTFREFNRVLFGDSKFGVGWEINRPVLKSLIEELKEQKKAGASEENLKKIKDKIWKSEIYDSGEVIGINVLPFNANNSFFFNRTEPYDKGKDFWKLLNDISWWNLSGIIVTFWLVFNVLDGVFSLPQKDGEETMVLSFTPGVKRSDLFFAKVLAFLTFYAIINLLLFLLPYGFYYFWVAKEKSFGAFSILSLYTTIIGPILFFGLILTPYIFANSWSGISGGIFSFIIAFFPMVWGVGKQWLFPLHTWPYTVEEKFFDPAIFTVISLVCGVIFLSLYYWKYQEEDLG